MVGAQPYSNVARHSFLQTFKTKLIMTQINYDALFSGVKSKDEITKAFRVNFDALMASYNKAVENFGKKPAKQTKKADVSAPALDAAETKARKTKAAKATAKPVTKAVIIDEPREKPEEVPALKLTDKKAIKALDIQLHQYTEKSFAITGDTKPLRNILKQLKGAFNRNLSVGEGWIFSVKYLPEVKAALCMK